MADKLTNKTRLKLGLSKAAAGINNVPDWVENNPVGIAPTGAPVYDNVKFSLIESFESEDSKDPKILGEYISTTISVSNNAKVARTIVNGRKGGSVKQMIAQDDYMITFNITIFGEMYPKGDLDDNVTIVKTGRTNRNQNYQGNYYPNAEMQKINEFLRTFYEDTTIQYVNVESNYLNSNFGINKIVPYSINTKQNHETTNSYTVIINAYSEISDEEADNITQEIIPNI